MKCSHEGFHAITSHYDHNARVLAYLRYCEQCGEHLGEVLRLPYEPRFEPAMARGLGGVPGSSARPV